MTKLEQLNELFIRWRKKDVFKPNGQRGQFIPDGIVCLPEYEKAKIKVLFMLKDLDDQTPELYYERGVCEEVLASTNAGNTWNPIAEWAYALTTGNPEYIHASKLGRNPFRTVAIMNLKKASGTESAEQIREFACNDRIEIIEEIKICDPDIILTCGRDDVFEVMKKIVVNEQYEEIPQILFGGKMKNYGHCLEISSIINAEKPIYVVEYRHPNRSGTQGTREEHYANMLQIRNVLFEA